MIARKQNLGHGMSAIHGRPRVTRRAELAIEERITIRALVIRHRTSEQSRRRVNDRQCGRLAAAQHEISDREPTGGKMTSPSPIAILVVDTQETDHSTSCA